MSCLSGRKTGRKNQLRFTGTVAFLALLAAAIFHLCPARVEAVADPEIIQWRAYQNAAELALSGRSGTGPDPEEFNFTSHGT